MTLEFSQLREGRTQVIKKTTVPSLKIEEVEANTVGLMIAKQEA